MRFRVRGGLLGIASMTLLCVLAAILPAPASAGAATSGSAVVAAPAVTAGATTGTFVPISPVRMLDTRPGGHTVDGYLAGLGAVQGGARIIGIVGRAGIPTAATAVVVNVTVTGATASTYVSVYPGPVIPPTSTVNAGPGATSAVASTVQLTIGDAFGHNPGTLWVYNKVGAIHVILDVTGYYLGVGLTAGSVLHTQNPVRVLDTRTAGHAAIAAKQYVSVALANTGTTAVALNVTVTGSRAAGYVTVWPGNSSSAPLATSSNVNFGAGQTVANMAVVGTPVAGGHPTFSVGNGGSSPVHVIVDVVGWYSSSPTLAAGGLRFHPISPTRLVDTRIPTGARPLSAGAIVAVATAGKIGDSLTQAIVANLTGLGDASSTYLSAFPGPTWPGTSSLNLGARQTASNMIMTGLALPARTFDLKNSVGTAQAIVDVTGYFEAAPPVSVSLVSNLATAATDQPVTFTATVVPVEGAVVPPGRVVLLDSTSGAILASRAYAGSPVQVVTAALSPAAHQMVAEFVADTPGGAPVSSSAVAVTVAAPAVSAAVTFQMDADHTGSAVGSTLTSSLHQAWSVDIGYLTYPVIAGGRVFAAGTDVSDVSRLAAFDAATGAVDWGPVTVSPTTVARGYAQLAYDGGKLFAVTTDGFVAAYSAAAGTVLWTAQLALPHGGGVWPPTAYDGVLYVSVAGQLYAMTEDSGYQLWTVPTVQSSSGASPDVDASGVYVGSPCAQANGFTTSGAARWPSVTSCIYESATAAIRMGDAFVPSSPAGAIILLSTGAIVPAVLAFDHIPSVDAQGFYLISAGTLTANAVKSWTFAGDTALDSATVMTDQLIFVRSWKGTLYAIDRSTGQTAWSVASGMAAAGPVYGTATGLAVSGGTLVVPTPVSTGSGWALIAYTSS